MLRRRLRFPCSASGPVGPLILCKVAFLIGLGWVLAACADPDPDGVPRTNLITGSTGSSWYTIGAAIAERTNVQFPGYPLMGVPGAGGVSNPARVARLGDDLGITHLPFLRAAYRGTEPYREPLTSLRHVATLIENKFHLIIADRLDVDGFEEILQRRLPVRIGTGPPGSGEEFLLREIMEELGTTVEDFQGWGGRLDLLGTGQRADAWRDNHIDVIVFSINEPASVVSEMLHSRAARIWPVPQEVMERLKEDWGVVPSAFAGGTYAGHPDPVPTIALPAAIFGTEEVDDRIIYEMVRTIAEGKLYLETVHAGFQAWIPEMMVESAGVPHHPAAERYFRERGWLEP